MESLSFDPNSGRRFSSFCKSRSGQIDKFCSLHTLGIFEVFFSSELSTRLLLPPACTPLLVVPPACLLPHQDSFSGRKREGRGRRRRAEGQSARLSVPTTFFEIGLERVILVSVCLGRLWLIFVSSSSSCRLHSLYPTGCLPRREKAKLKDVLRRAGMGPLT